MEERKLIAKSNDEIAAGVFKIIMAMGESEALHIEPGQFVNIAIPGFYLRRPISVCDYDGKEVTLIYKVVGAGTESLSEITPGDGLNVLLPLGKGYEISEEKKNPILIGGGVGTPPLYYTAKQLLKKRSAPEVILGFNTAEEVFYEEEFAELGCTVHVVTVDGSRGETGYPTDIMKELDYDYFYACGPLPMLKAVCGAAEEAGVDGQLSLEERMGCGFGACMGCSMKLRDSRSVRICKDGPVFHRRELPW